MVNREDDFPIEITRVIDGDGFEARALDGSDRTFEVRLYAIDAPEGTQKYGKEATDHLRQEVKGGRFWLEVKGTDPNGRTVAVVYKDTYDTVHTLNYLMVRTGWAYWYFGYDTGNSFGLREAEIAAYMDCKGVWQEPEVERPWDYKKRIRLEIEDYQERIRLETEEKERLEAAERERLEAVERKHREAEERKHQLVAARTDQEALRLLDGTNYAQKLSTWFKEGKYDLVITGCAVVLRQGPNQVEPHEFRARAYIEEGKYDLAIVDCKAALRLYPDSEEIQRLMRFAQKRRSANIFRFKSVR